MPRAQDVARMTTQEVRDTFHIGNLFSPGKLQGHFTELDRLVVGGVMPAEKPVELPNHKETGRAFFLERRNWAQSTLVDREKSSPTAKALNWKSWTAFICRWEPNR